MKGRVPVGTSNNSRALESVDDCALADVGETADQHSGGHGAKAARRSEALDDREQRLRGSCGGEGVRQHDCATTT